MKPIFPDELPIPKGHYSPAVVHNGLVYVSGQLPFDQNGNPFLGAFEEQTKLCLRNMQTILLASGSDKSKIIKIQVFLSHIEDWPVFNRLYKEFMDDHKPARIVVPCNNLHYGCSIELDCIAIASQ